MAVHADRTRGRKRGAPRPDERVLAHGRRRAVLSAGLATAALLTAFATPATAQQTVIIGGPAIIGPGAGGLIVNNEVLESLGSSLEVPALPYQAPGRGFGGAPVTPVTPGFPPSPVGGTVIGAGVGAGVGPGVGTVPGIAYRQPDTGQLLVTRPGRLLFPPPHAPRSRLATAMPEAPPEAPVTKPEPELTSRLLVPPPPQTAKAPEAAPVEAAPVEPAPVEPVVETPVAAAAAEPEAVAPTPEPAPPPAPEPQVAAQPEPSLPEPSASAEAPPPPSTLAEELTQKPAPAEPSQEPATVAPTVAAPAITAKAEPAPPPEPAVQPPAPTSEPAPPAPPAPAPAEAESEPPPPPAESLTSGPAVEPQTAALPPAPALAEQIRILFPDGSVELTSDAERRLSAVATALMESTTVRIQLLAYAKASSDGASRARRLSLSRALAVRAYLIEKGVRSTRMDVRALGDKIGDGPADRVDIRPQATN